MSCNIFSCLRVCVCVVCACVCVCVCVCVCMCVCVCVCVCSQVDILDYSCPNYYSYIFIILKQIVFLIGDRCDVTLFKSIY